MPFLAVLRANLLATLLGLAAIVFAVIAVVQSVQLNGFLWIDGVRDELADCVRDRNELRAATSKKDEQKPITQRNIEEAEKGRKGAETIAKRIEAAPLPGNCATPKEIMGADL